MCLLSKSVEIDLNSYSSIIIFEKMDTVIRVYSSLVGQRTLLMSELDKFGALNLRAESEKVKNNYRTHLYRGDVLKSFYGSPITNAT